MILLVVVAIGRNIGTAPMPIARWHRFQRETADVLETLGAVMTRAQGRYKGSKEWGAEDTALFVVDTALGSGAIQQAMRAVMQRYRQEAIGIIRGVLED